MATAFKRTSIADQASGPRTRSKGANSYLRSTVTDANDSAELEQSVPAGTQRREPGPAQKTRRKANSQRDGRTNAGTGKQSVITS
jgi:hypothetical protein